MGLIRDLAAERRYARIRYSHSRMAYWVMYNYRFGAWLQKQSGVKRLLGKVVYFFSNFIVSSLSSSDISAGAQLGPRFTPHTFRGVIITKGVVTGSDVWVNNDVAIAWRANGRSKGVARIGNNVIIGMGARILGDVTIGDNVIIGANAVVLKDVPSNHIAVGIPAVNKPKPELAEKTRPAERLEGQPG